MSILDRTFSNRWVEVKREDLCIDKGEFLTLENG